MSIYNVKCPVFLEDGGINVTSPFGWRIHPISGKGEGHAGVDITRWTGYSNLATITAFADGIVTGMRNTVPWVDTDNPANSAGNYIIIDHGGGWVSKYFHLKYDSVCVTIGQKVGAGDEIGYMGTTGNSTGAHLHFQLEKDGTPVDGLPYLLGQKYIKGETEMENEKVETKRDGNTPHTWGKEAVEWAKENNILLGSDSGKADYRLHDAVTREEMLVFLYRAFDRAGMIE